MNRFTLLYHQIEHSNSPKKKVQAFIDYFSSVPDRDKLWAIGLFTNKRPKKIVDLIILRLWVTDLICIPDWLFDESLAVVSDQCETIGLLVSKKKDSDEKSLSEWMQEISDFSKKNEDDIKEWVIDSWNNLDNNERILFNKLITGGFRKSVSVNIISKALSIFYDIEKTHFAHRLVGKWNPINSHFNELLLTENYKDYLSRPFEFMFTTELQTDPSLLGTAQDWLAEWNLNGLRAQLIYRNNELFVWTTAGELVTDYFPTLKKICLAINYDFVVDGVIIGMQNKKILPSSELTKLIHRKTITNKSTSAIEFEFMAFDVLEYRSNDTRKQPLIKRKSLLNNLKQDSFCNVLKISEEINFENWNQINAKINDLETRKSESLILKEKSAPYEIVSNPFWWKLKAEPYSVLAVLTYAQKSPERGSLNYVEFTFGLWEDQDLISFAKTPIDLPEDEIVEIIQFVRKNTIERFGPVYSISAELVFEISFENIHPSKRHKSGIQLKNPNIKKWHKEINAKDAHRLKDLMLFLKN